jgi:hypothetical protein
MRNAILLQPGTEIESLEDRSEVSNATLSVVLPFQPATVRVEHADQRSRRQLVSTKELSEDLGCPRKHFAVLALCGDRSNLCEIGRTDQV